MFRQLVNKTADCFNNIVFTLVAKISSKNVCEKMENNSRKRLEKVLLVFNSNTELLRSVGATFDSKVTSLRRMRKKNLIILKSLQKKSLVVVLELRSENCNMLTERTYDSDVFKIFRNIITIWIFIDQ